MKMAYGLSPLKSIDEIKLDALYQGVKMAIAHGYQNIIINVDSATVVHYIKMEKPSWSVSYK